MTSYKIIIAIITICLSSIIIAQESYKCNIYRCSQFGLNSNQCIYSHPLFKNSTADNQAFDIDLSCSHGSYCPPIYNAENQTCSQMGIASNLVHGDSCRNNTNCGSNICNNEKCAGLQPLAVCTNNQQCQIGYYCGKLTVNSLVKNCLPQNQVNQPCESDYECVNNLACHNLNKTCTSYFSLPDGTKNEGAMYLCQSSKIYKGYCVSTKLYQNSDECLPNNGTLQTECQYTTTGLPDEESDKIYKSSCQCSKAHHNRKFCEYDTENPQWQKLINALKEWFNHDALLKHTSRRDDFSFDIRRMILTIEEYPQYKDADDCAINIDASSQFLGNILLTFIFGLFYILFI